MGTKVVRRRQRVGIVRFYILTIYASYNCIPCDHVGSFSYGSKVYTIHKYILYQYSVSAIFFTFMVVGSHLL